MQNRQTKIKTLFCYFGRGSNNSNWTTANISSKFYCRHIYSTKNSPLFHSAKTIESINIGWHA